jgi:hypothetical protein
MGAALYMMMMMMMMMKPKRTPSLAAHPHAPVGRIRFDADGTRHVEAWCQNCGISTPEAHAVAVLDGRYRTFADRREEKLR